MSILNTIGSVVEPSFEDDSELNKLKVRDAANVEELSFSFEIVKLKQSELKFLEKALGTEYKNTEKIKLLTSKKTKNMKLKDLISNREKLKKYDELKEWKDLFEDKKNDTILLQTGTDFGFAQNSFIIPKHIKQIFISALDAEIKKLDEE